MDLKKEAVINLEKKIGISKAISMTSKTRRIKPTQSPIVMHNSENWKY